MPRLRCSAWSQTSDDPNDTVLASDGYATRIAYAGTDPGQLADKRAAQLAAAHDSRPTVVHTDRLGGPGVAVGEEFGVGGVRRGRQVARGPAGWAA